MTKSDEITDWRLPLGGAVFVSIKVAKNKVLIKYFESDWQLIPEEGSQDWNFLCQEIKSKIPLRPDEIMRNRQLSVLYFKH